jgi:hypothetical protein
MHRRNTPDLSGRSPGRRHAFLKSLPTPIPLDWALTWRRSARQRKAPLASFPSAPPNQRIDQSRHGSLTTDGFLGRLQARLESKKSDQ